MSIKCLAFDLDGTLLLDESKKMDPRTVESIKKAMSQGIHIVIASGRDKNGCKFVYEPLGLEDGNHFLALVNGQIIYDFENKEYDLDDVLTAEDGVKIQKVCKEFGVEGIFQCGYDFYSYISSLNRMKKKVVNAILGEPEDYGLKDGKENRNFINLPFEEIYLTQDINKAIMVHSKRFFEKNYGGIKTALSDYDVLLVGPDWMEIMPKNVTKASALWKICDRLGISMNEVMAFGDAQNDNTMLEYAGWGVSMLNGSDSTKAIANDITEYDSNHDGVGHYLEKLFK